MRGLVAPAIIISSLLGVAWLGASLIGSASAPQDEWRLVEHECQNCRYVNGVDGDIWFWSCSRCGTWHTQGQGEVKKNH